MKHSFTEEKVLFVHKQRIVRASHLSHLCHRTCKDTDHIHQLVILRLATSEHEFLRYFRFWQTAEIQAIETLTINSDENLAGRRTSSVVLMLSSNTLCRYFCEAKNP